MIGLNFLFKRKREEIRKTSQPPVQASAEHKKEPLQPFSGGVPERTQDFLGRQDGERVGFRMPIQG